MGKNKCSCDKIRCEWSEHEKPYLDKYKFSITSYNKETNEALSVEGRENKDFACIWCKVRKELNSLLYKKY